MVIKNEKSVNILLMLLIEKMDKEILLIEGLKKAR